MCVVQFFTGHYKGYCCVVKDVTTKEEIIMFRPSSMPITDKIQEDTRFDEQNWESFSSCSFTPSIAIRQQVNKMDDAIYQYVKKVLPFVRFHRSRLPSRWTRASASPPKISG